MTNLFHRLALAVCLAGSAMLPAEAQNRSIASAGEPAEQPPAGFEGRQYVDSRGCVYIRAGFDGNVTWVPRVTRGRQVVCGFQPTFPNGTATASAPAQPQQQRATASQRQAAPAPRQQQTQPRVVQRPAPQQQPPVAYATPTQRVPTGAPQPRSGGNPCAGVTGLSAEYLRSNGRHAVRCGPQAENPYTGGRGATLTVPDARALSTPPGYQAAFDDGRLNPNRGVQTLTGNGQMSLVWTQTVPRRLIDRNTGRDVTHLIANRRPTGPQKVTGNRVTIVTPDGNRSHVIVTNRANAAPGSNVRYSTKGN